MRYAQIKGGKVFVIFERDGAPAFAKNINMVSCGSEVEEGWDYDGVTFSAPVVVPPPARTLLSRAELVELIGVTAYAGIYRAAHGTPADDTALFFLAKINASISIETSSLSTELAQFVTDTYITAGDKTRIEAGL